MRAERDYYAILNVPPTATPEEIKRAFRQRVRAAHPDNGGTAERVAVVTEAWDVLGDGERRRIYDVRRARARAKRQGSGAREGAVKAPRKNASPTWGRILGTLVGRAFNALTGTPASAARAGAKGAVKMKIVRCRCGQKLRVKAVAGAQARCPKCKGLCGA